MFIIQFNDGRLVELQHSGEARVWLALSIDFSLCNVYQRGGSALPLCFIPA
jgi:hypothetical protein